MTQKPAALIVEDDIDSARLYTRLLNKAGYDCHVCSNYQDALETLDTFVPELLILDLRIGSLALGPRLLNIIRSDPRYSNLTIAVISAYQTKTRALSDLVDFTMVKPIDARQFLNWASELISE